MRIIDMHAHVDVCEPLNWYDTAEKLITLMDEAGAVFCHVPFQARDGDDGPL